MRGRGIIDGGRSAGAIFTIIDEIKPIKGSCYECEEKSKGFIINGAAISETDEGHDKGENTGNDIDEEDDNNHDSKG